MTFNSILRTTPGGKNLNETKGDVRDQEKTPQRNVYEAFLAYDTESGRGGEQ